MVEEEIVLRESHPLGVRHWLVGWGLDWRESGVLALGSPSLAVS